MNRLSKYIIISIVVIIVVIIFSLSLV